MQTGNRMCLEKMKQIEKMRTALMEEVRQGQVSLVCDRICK